MSSINPRSIIIKWVSQGNEKVKREVRGMRNETEKFRSSVNRMSRITTHQVKRMGRSFSRTFNTIKQKILGARRALGSFSSAGIVGTQFNSMMVSMSRSVTRLRVAIRKTSSAISGMTALIGVGAIGLGIKKITELSDSYTTLKNRLAIVTTEQEKQLYLLNKLTGLAQRTRADASATVDVFSKMYIAMEPIGYSLQEIMEFTEVLNQSISVSGASSVEAEQALLQLSQGLSLGVLRGQDLKSVLSQLPYLAARLAEGLELKDGIAGLLAMGEAGKLTTDALVGSSRKVAAAIAKDFSAMGLRFSDVMTEMKKSLLDFAQVVEEASGVSNIFVKGLMIFARNLDVVIVGSIIPTIMVLRVALLGLMATPAGAPIAFAVFIGFLASVTYAFLKWTGALDYIVAGLRWISSWAGTIGMAIINAFYNAFHKLGFYVGKFFAWLLDKQSQTYESTMELNSALELWMRSNKKFQETNMAATFVPYERAINQQKEKIEEVKSSYIELISFSDELNDTLNQKEPTVQFRGQFAEIGRKFQAAKDLIKTEDFQIDVVIDATAASLKTFMGQLELLEKENELLKLNDTQRRLRKKNLELEEKIQRKLTEEEKKSIAATIKKGDLIKAENNLLKKIKGPEQDRIQRTALLNSLYEKGAITLAEYSAEMEKMYPKPPQLKTFKDMLEMLRQETEMLRLNEAQRRIREESLKFEEELQRKLTAAERERIAAIVEKGEQITREAQILKDIRGPQEEQARTIETLNSLYDRGVISMDEYIIKLDQMGLVAKKVVSRDFTSALKEGLRKTKNMGEYFGDLLFGVGGAIDKLTNKIVDFVKTGTFSLRKFFIELASTILSAMLKLLALKAFATVLGVPLGGVSPAGAGAGAPQAGIRGAAQAYGGGAQYAAAQYAAPRPASGGGGFLGGLFRGAGGGGISGMDILSAFGMARSLMGQEQRGQQVQEPRGPIGRGAEKEEAPGMASLLMPMVGMGMSYLMNKAATGAATGSPLKIVNVINPMQMLSAMASTQGEQSIVNVIGRNAPTVKRILGQ